MLQASLFDGVAFDPFPFQQNDLAASEIDVGGREIAQLQGTGSFCVPNVCLISSPCRLRCARNYLLCNQFSLSHMI